jgi:nucleoside-diphosphate-sugar epimerase
VSSPVLVTGAGGALGPILVRDLLEQGRAVRALCRRAPPPGLLPREAEVLVGDVSRVEDAAAAMRGIRQVFHLASLLHVANPEPSLKDAYEAVNVEGTSHVVAAAKAERARVIFFSSIVVYGPTRGTSVDETSSPRPVGLYAETKRRAEEVVLASGVPAVVLRLAAVYGSRMKGNYRRLAESLRRQRFLPIGHGENRRTLIHEEDVSRAALLVAERPEAAGQIFNVTDGEIHSMRQIIAAICAALGRPEPRWSIPENFARLGAVLADAVFSAFRRRSGYADLVDKYLENMEIRGEKLQRLLGFRPLFDLESGWRQALGLSGVGRPPC